ncbi:MAG: hypothetical protein A2Z83_06060 [Omnitrophica bacterium GWA2_52_8]|nr:MAG: hypothetical protein A2Z83_06060 [Omnitrophica bacterium GWA2_52_8]
MAQSDAPFFDRELSWLEFNMRVLQEAMNPANPLMERLKFAGIVSSNLDEFFMVRIASFSQKENRRSELTRKAFEQMNLQADYFVSHLVPEMQNRQIVKILPAGLSPGQREHLAQLFEKELKPLLTPVAIHADRPCPDLLSLSLYVVAALKDPQLTAETFYAVIELPKNFTRMVALPEAGGYAFILLEDVIALFAEELFQGYRLESHGTLRFTRGVEMTLDEEKDEDFAETMSEALQMRRRSQILRCEIAASDAVMHFIKEKFQIPEEIICRSKAWPDLKGVSQLAFLQQFESLRRPEWQPQPVPVFEEAQDVWEVIKHGDVMVHHPYHSFDAVIRFLAEAAEDPDVLAIKQTLYRASPESAVIAWLERAAENGKQVTVLVELKARFDEERNIRGARRLENAGASVLYGVSGYKTHAKACLVIRREAEGIKRYVHLATGNYNEKTARLYTDIGIFSCNDALTADVSSFFNVMTGYSHPAGFSKIEIAPFGLRKRIERLILREAMRSTKENPGFIMAKLNSLVDRDVIHALYRASQAGVKIRLNVRGICCLVPGVPGVSENIEVVSIVDMFLEHSRVFYFYDSGHEEMFLSSADWMPRNFDRRLEILFPVEDAKRKKELKEILEACFKDNTNAWQLNSGGVYERKQSSGDEKKFRLQEHLCRKTLSESGRKSKSPQQDLKPQKPKHHEDIDKGLLKILPPKR